MNWQKSHIGRIFRDCYPLDERHLKISIQTGKDVDEVILWAGDPYSAGIAENEQNWQGERVPMELGGNWRTEMYTVPSLHRRTAGSSTILRSPAAGRASACLRMVAKKQRHFPADRMIQRFIYPWMNGRTL